MTLGRTAKPVAPHRSRDDKPVIPCGVAAATLKLQGKWRRHPMARITVIDDSSDFLDLMRELIDVLGHHMTGIAAVTSTIDEVVDTEPELLVVDLVLPHPQEGSGWDVLLMARAHPALRRVPIILCTADVWGVKQRAADLQQFADVHVITKPFELDEISQLIQDSLAADFEAVRAS